MQGVGFGMVLLQALTRLHVTFALVAARVVCSLLCYPCYSGHGEQWDWVGNCAPGFLGWCGAVVGVSLSFGWCYSLMGVC